MVTVEDRSLTAEDKSRALVEKEAFQDHHAPPGVLGMGYEMPELHSLRASRRRLFGGTPVTPWGVS